METKSRLHFYSDRESINKIIVRVERTHGSIVGPISSEVKVGLRDLRKVCEFFEEEQGHHYLESMT